MTAGIIPQLSCIVKVMLCTTTEEIVDGYAAVVADQEEADWTKHGGAMENRDLDAIQLT